MRNNPDAIIFLQYGFLKLNATILFTWGLMFILTVSSKIITHKLSKKRHLSRWLNLLEIIIIFIEKQINDVGLHLPRNYIGFLGTLFLFVAIASMCTIIPGYVSPTASLSTTSALALCVLIAVPFFGIKKQGIINYFKSYIKPTFFMVFFNIISEMSRTLALAIRLFGNMMSGTIIISILLSITPYIFPIVMTAFGLFTGIIQAYIIFILSTVYIAAATKTARYNEESTPSNGNKKSK